MVGQAQGRRAAVRVLPRHCDVLSLADDAEAQVFKGPERPSPSARRRETSPSGHPGLSNVHFQHRRLFLQRLAAKRLDVEVDGRRHVGECSVVRIALTDHDSLESERIAT